MLAGRIYHWLSPETATTPARLFRAAHHTLVGAGLVAVVSDTVEPMHAKAATALDIVFWVALAFFTIEYVLRLWTVSEAPWAPVSRPWIARWHWMRGSAAVIDLIALLPLVCLVAGMPEPMARILGAFWILKFGRYSEGMAMVGRVLRNARAPMESLFLAFLVVLLLAATLGYLAERDQPNTAFTSIPASLWWAVVTLTTTGYGDVVPQTVLGRFIAGMVMICGIAVFAFMAGILANSFAEEMHRRQFLRTWDLVARVPFFQSVGAATIAEVAKLLRPQEIPPGAIVARRGAAGDCMYFIASGEVAIEIEPQPIVLGAGQFFGEIALITGSRRSATVVARTRCELLLLDIADFRRLAAQQPDLARVIDEEARRRMGVAPQINVAAPTDG
ncbi:MAG TPA: cyclic nucleotide-gated ion channel [Stellaceae bacterium]|nr:cyclic nucleotide-gated ion channel [Stellaceae bacterium]